MKLLNLALNDRFEGGEQKIVDAWVEKIGKGHEKAVNSSNYFTNRYSKSVRLLAIAGMILERDDWAKTAEQGVKRFVRESLHVDGTSRDLKHRDSLTYHGGALKPPMEFASYFDPGLMGVVRHLSETKAQRFPTWRTLVNVAARPAE